MVVIGVTGKKRNGKDTVGDYLVKNHNFIKLSFADPLKQACKILFNFSDEQLYGNDKETIDSRWNTSPRKVLQYLGTDIFRNNMNQIIPDINNDFWVKCLEIKIKELLNVNPNTNIVICDVRFQNEVDMIHNINGTIIRVTRDNIINNDSHISENNIDELIVDFDIFNNKKLVDLYMTVSKILNL